MDEAFEFRLLNDFQRDFPLVPEPFVVLAEQLEGDEIQVLEALGRLQEEGVVSRVGAVFSPRRIGASTLAALAVPPERLDAVADEVSACAEVNHNYERENAWNLWFVATTADAPRLARLLAEIEEQTGCPMIRLPLLEEFHIDLGFDLKEGRSAAAAAVRPASPGDAHGPLQPMERRLMAALQDGLPFEPRPFKTLGAKAGLAEEAVLALLREWQQRGLIKRFGVVVRHHELGWSANAMCVWDVPDTEASALGQRLALMPGVTLCYRRARDLPAWPYNLYCMIHGRARDEVEARVAVIVADLSLAGYPHEVLFSLRRYKQRGAHYLPYLPA